MNWFSACISPFVSRFPDIHYVSRLPFSHFQHSIPVLSDPLLMLKDVKFKISSMINWAGLLDRNTTVMARNSFLARPLPPPPGNPGESSYWF